VAEELVHVPCPGYYATGALQVPALPAKYVKLVLPFDVIETPLLLVQSNSGVIKDGGASNLLPPGSVNMPWASNCAKAIASIATRKINFFIIIIFGFKNMLVSYE